MTTSPELQALYDELTKVMYKTEENESLYTQIVRTKKMKDILEEIEKMTKAEITKDMEATGATEVNASGYVIRMQSRVTKKLKLDVTMAKLVAPEVVVVSESIDQAKLDAFIELKGQSQEDYYTFNTTEYLVVSEVKEKKAKK